MRVALIQPDSPYLKTPLAFPSLGLLYISSYLKVHGVKTDFYDLTGGKELPDIEADIIGFSCQITQFQEVQKLSKRCKGKLVIGGAFPTHTHCEGFYNIQGEGEEAFLQYILGEEKDLKHIDPNFFPDWEAIDLKRYGYSLEGKRCINLMTKRGNCPFHCTFCAKQETGKSPLRFRTIGNILEEIHYLRDKGFEALAIYDDDVLINKKRDYELFSEIKKLGMPYRCMTRTDLATKEDLQMLKATGCAEVAIGVESADPYIHNVVCNKGTTIEQDTQFVMNCKEIGLRVKTYLIIGLPSESLESAMKTKMWIKETRPDNFDISIFTPYLGSYIYSHKNEFDINWDEEELKKIWFSGEAQYGSCAVRTTKLSSNGILRLKEILEEGRGEGGKTDYWRPL
jgi:radical SAM superfamily enzyme YgiQ (UPF0313 family)